MTTAQDTVMTSLPSRHQHIDLVGLAESSPMPFKTNSLAPKPMQPGSTELRALSSELVRCRCRQRCSVVRRTYSRFQWQRVRWEPQTARSMPLPLPHRARWSPSCPSGAERPERIQKGSVCARQSRPSVTYGHVGTPGCAAGRRLVCRAWGPKCCTDDT